MGIVSKFIFSGLKEQVKYISILRKVLSSQYIMSAAVEENVSDQKRTREEVDEENVTKKLKTSGSEETGDIIPVKNKKKMQAVLLSYCGKGYYGMQRNPGSEFITIEGELLSAMLKAGIIDRELYDHPQSMWFQRAARTDKGVSAARQIVCMKIPVDSDTVSQINAHLPEQIRVIAMKPAKKKFNAKCHCDARTYTYISPTFAFAPVDKITSEDYRITDEVCEEIQIILDMYKGSHYYHNFTSGKKAGEDSARRYIMDFTIGKPFVREGIEFVALTVKGQSFMLHQIRKMVAMVMVIMRGFGTKESLKLARKVEKMDIPIAPGLGLILEAVHYDKYNKRFLGDGIHEQLVWDEYEDLIQEMKEKYIYRTIIDEEVKEKSMLLWLDTLTLHDFNRRATGSAIQETIQRTAFEHAALTVQYEYGDKSEDKASPQVEETSNENSKSNKDVSTT